MELQGIISKWHLGNDDVTNIYQATKAIEGEIDRMIARRYQVAGILASRGIEYNGLALHNDTPALSNAIDYQYWSTKRNA